MIKGTVVRIDSIEHEHVGEKVTLTGKVDEHGRHEAKLATGRKITVDQSEVSVHNEDQPVDEKPKHAGGRPTKYSLELANQICAELAAGNSLFSICERDDMPHRSTIYSWFDTNPEFTDKYAKAKDDSADALSDQIQLISDNVLSGRYDPAAARVAIDAKKWVASKMKPKKYGNQIDVTSGGEKLPQPLLGGTAITEHAK